MGAVLIAGVMLVGAGRRHAFQTSGTGKGQVVAALIFLASAPLAENLVMMQHATQFSFDRVKFIVPAAIVLVAASVLAGRMMRSVLFALLAVACVGNVYTYREDIAAYAWFDPIDRDNRALVTALADATDGACTRYATNVNVRGYMNLLFERSITERFKETQIAQISEVFNTTGACHFIYLSGTHGEVDLPKLLGATVYQRDGSSIAFAVEDGIVTQQLNL
jgi:crotonobetainyl-CoA:carnitine CoA-transferase CaiB-like acyl-CoA transferase